MFYLGQLGSLVRKNPITFLSIYVLGVFILVLSLNYKTFEKTAMENLSKKTPGSYFFTLIDGKIDYLSYIRKVKVLPGIAKITELSTNEIKEQLKEALSSINDEQILKEFDKDYAGMRVEFDAETSEHSQNLIKEYIKRLFGQDSVTVGQTISISETSSRNGYNDILINWLVAIIIFVSLLVWFFIYRIAIHKVREISFLVQKFQRKRDVGIKIIIIVFVLMFLVSLAISFVYFELSLLALIITSFFAIVLVFVEARGHV